MNADATDLPEYETSEEGTPAHVDDTSDGTTAPKADPDKLAAEQPDAALEPADDTPAEAGDDTGVDHEGNELDADADAVDQARAGGEQA